MKNALVLIVLVVGCSFVGVKGAAASTAKCAVTDRASHVSIAIMAKGWTAHKVCRDVRRWTGFTPVRPYHLGTIYCAWYRQFSDGSAIVAVVGRYRLAGRTFCAILAPKMRRWSRVK